MALNKQKKMALALTSAIFFTIFDRLLKMFALLNLGDKSLPLVADFLKLSLAKNNGIAFSLPFYGTFLNIIIILIVFGLFAAIFNYHKNNRTAEAYALIFVFFGAISNLFDRISYSYVIDYLDLRYFTIFNIADVMIVCGIAYYILLNSRSKNNKKTRSNDEKTENVSQG